MFIYNRIKADNDAIYTNVDAIRNLILIAGHVTEHARNVLLSLGCSNIWRYTFMEMYRQLVQS